MSQAPRTDTPQADGKEKDQLAGAPYHKPVEKVSIEQFDPDEFKMVNSPRSLEAMRLLGVGQLDLRLQRHEDIKGMFNETVPEEKKMLEKIVKSNLENHALLLVRIKEKRRELIEKEEARTKKARRHEKETKSPPQDRPKSSAHKPDDRKQQPSRDPKNEESKKPGQAESASLGFLPIGRSKKLELPDPTKNSIDFIRDKQKRELEYMMGLEIYSQKLKKKKEEMMKEKIETIKKEQNEKLQRYNETIMRVQREKELKNLEKKFDRERKLFNVERIGKAKEYEREVMVKKLNEVDHKFSRIKEDRELAFKNREVLRKQLNKDLHLMRDGLISEEVIRSKYSGIHDEEVFEGMIADMKKEMGPKGVSRRV